MENHWCDGSGRLNLLLAIDEAGIGYHQGDCEEGVRYLMSLPHIQSQTEFWDKEAIRDNLREYGAWDESELADDEMSLLRTIWLACGDIVDNPQEDE